MATTSLEIKKHFRSLRDPRRRHRRLHRLLDIVVIAVCAVTGGADNWEEIAAFGRRHESWFRRYLSLYGGMCAPIVAVPVRQRAGEAAAQRSEPRSHDNRHGG